MRERHRYLYKAMINLKRRTEQTIKRIFFIGVSSKISNDNNNNNGNSNRGNNRNVIVRKSNDAWVQACKRASS